MLDVSEVWHWGIRKQSSKIFKDYIQTFLKTKTEASGWPNENMSESEKSAYLEEYEKKEGIKLDETRICKNDGLRFISKLLLNSFWGYLGMKNNLSQTRYINSYAEIVNAFDSGETDVTDLFLINEELALLQYKKKATFVEHSPKTNVILAAFTTAHARKVLYGYMDGLEDKTQIVYCDTDSIMYIQNGTQRDIPTGRFLGDMTDELPPSVRVDEFFCAGPKFYLLQGENNKTKEPYITFKVKGLSINKATEASVNPKTIKALISREIEALSSPFGYLKRMHEQRCNLVSVQCYKDLRLTSIKRNFNFVNGTSLPFGY